MPACALTSYQLARSRQLTEYHDGLILSAGNYRKYLIALYWASGTSTGLGTAVTPANEYEWAFVSCAHAFGVIVMGVQHP